MRFSIFSLFLFVCLGCGGWTPVDPNPPTPVPIPIPIPTVDPSPISDEGLRVLIVEETARRDKLEPDQLDILTSPEIDAYCDQHCIKNSEGTPEFRVWDKDISGANNSEPLQRLFLVPRTADFWLYVSNGKTGFSGPLPKDVPAVMELLKKHTPQ